MRVGWWVRRVSAQGTLVSAMCRGAGGAREARQILVGGGLWVGGGGGGVVGDRQGGLVAADVGDRDLADLAADLFQFDHVLVQSGPPVAAGPADGGGLPRRCRERG